MKLRNQLLSLALTALFLTGGALSAAENLVTNGGFEAEEELVFTGGRRAGPAGQWTVRMWGDWVGKVAKSDIVSYSTDARTGKRALSIDTTALNPSGKITDDFRSPRNPKYTIFVTRKIEGIKPDSWYLAKFRIKSAGISVDEGLEYIADLQPWPLKTFGPQAKARPLWKMIHAWERRLFLPQAPIADGEYHEYVWLKQTYKENDSIEIGIRIRAPWTGKIILDDVELRQVDPDEDMTAMEKFLAMRATKPLREVRTLNRETTLVSDGKATGAILIPDDPAYAPLGRRIASRIKKLTGANLPVVTRLADVPEGAQIVAVGSMMKNELVGRLHFNRYVEIDALSPGPGGYIVWTVAEPYGLAKKQNVIVVGGSDLTGEKAAVDDFCGMLTAEGKSIRLPLLHKVFPKKTIPEDEREVPRKNWGLKWDRNRFSGFAKWYLSRWLETGDLEVARLARDEIMKVADAYLENPYFQTQWCSYEVGWAWDAMEEVPVFSDADRLKISNILLGYMHMRMQAGTSGWSRMEPRLAKDGPTWNHQAKGLVGAYATARYFNRYYGDQDWRYRNYLATAGNCFGEQAKYSKPQENSANYWLITMRFSLAYYLGEWDKTFFANDAMRRYAEYFAMICDNKGGISGFGDAYYCYTGWKGGVGTKDWAVPLGFWWYKDGRMLWWTKHVLADYKNPYHQDVEPVEWKELVGVKKIPLEEGLYVPAGTSARWSAGSGKGAETAGKVSFAESFDKITFRENWDYEGQYMSLEGITRGIHSGVGINQICKLSLLGEDLLIGSTYKGNNVRTNCSVVVVKDAGIDDEAAKGKGRFAFQWWAPLAKASPGYAALKTLTDLPRTGFTRTSVPDYLGGTDWHRNVFWLKGGYFVLIDEVVAKESGTYYVESNFSTCPRPRKGTYPALTQRTWKMLEGGRVFEVSYKNDAGVKHYIVGDGDSTMTIDPTVYQAQYINKTMVRQVYEGMKIEGGQKATLLTLMYGDRASDRKNYRLERLSPTEGLIFQGERAVAYFGTVQSEKAKAILPVSAEQFLLTGDMLAVVNGTKGGRFMTSEKPVSREVKIPASTVDRALNRLARLLDE